MIKCKQLKKYIKGYSCFEKNIIFSQKDGILVNFLLQSPTFKKAPKSNNKIDPVTKSEICRH